MRPSARLIRTAFIALLAGCLTWVVAAGGALGATKLYDGTSDTDATVAVPQLTSPYEGTALAYPSQAVRLSWDAVAGAKSYEVQVARPATGVACSSTATFLPERLVSSAKINDTTWVPTMLKSSSTDTADTASASDTGSAIGLGTYCWRVRTSGAGSSAGGWSGARTFTRTWSSVPTGLRFYNDTDGAIPRTSADADYASGDARSRNGGYVTWSAVPGASAYDLEIATTRTFSKAATILTQTGIRQSTTLVPHLDDDTYYWRVRAHTASGVTGEWSTAASAFTVEWEDPQWTATNKLYPADGATASELRIGWTPIAGAAYYEYQLGTNAGCFWEPSDLNAAPDAYGDWVNKPSKYDESTPPHLLYTSDPQPTQCRLSKTGATTLNNFVTLSDILDDEVSANIGKPCVSEDGTIECEPAGLPDSVPDIWGAAYHGATESGSSDGALGDAYSIWWRVRPVYKLKVDSLSGYKVGGEITSYGSWTQFTDGGENRQHHFDFNPSTAALGSVGTRCTGTSNPTTNRCLVHNGTSLTAVDTPGETDSTSMQVPVFTWQPFQAAGGYMIQVARDPNFNSMVLTHYEPGVKARGYGFQQSWVPTEGLPDNAEGSGYWWRVIPCSSSVLEDGELTNCAPFYSAASGGKPLSVVTSGAGYSDAAVAQTFTKRTEVVTKVTPRFAGDNPVIQWTTTDRSHGGQTDWVHGVDGAEFYEVELSQDPHLGKDVTTLKTTSPYITPFLPSTGEAGLTKELPGGAWYFRVRAIDRGAIEGSWSDIGTFDKQVSAPLATNDTGTGVGATLSWAPVEGADSYTVEYGPDPQYGAGTNSFGTAQTAASIPAAATGTQFWRVRANVGGVTGVPSATKAVTIITASTIKYGISAPVVAAGGATLVDGQLLLNGAAINGKTVQLQRKTTNCNVGGNYRQVGTSVTGKSTSQGMVRFKAKIATSSCYRMAYAGPTAVVYSAPFSISARPTVKVKLDRRKVKNGGSFCTKVSTKTALTGRTQIQYKVGSKWVVARNATIRSKKGFKQCAAIRSAGNYTVRLALVGLVHPTKGYQTYADTYISLGKVRVNNVFSRIS